MQATTQSRAMASVHLARIIFMTVHREMAEWRATNARTGWSLLFIWSFSFVWLNQTDQTDQMNQINLRSSRFSRQSRPSRLSQASAIAAEMLMNTVG
jgi:hypothetical protein